MRSHCLIQHWRLLVAAGFMCHIAPALADKCDASKKSDTIRFEVTSTDPETKALISDQALDGQAVCMMISPSQTPKSGTLHKGDKGDWWLYQDNAPPGEVRRVYSLSWDHALATAEDKDQVIDYSIEKDEKDLHCARRVNISLRAAIIVEVTVKSSDGSFAQKVNLQSTVAELQPSPNVLAAPPHR